MARNKRVKQKIVGTKNKIFITKQHLLKKKNKTK